ncbi:MAG: BrnT family toxin [Xanthobacteraceae bacterium]|nr:BrnT family toxin [Xanthobacteraceae bacterium]MBV9627265.1 BrnT family toxin [Xanthobacteraceae bacterium]
MQEDGFEWDDVKNAQNLARHGVSFEAAKLAFSDMFAVIRQDRRQDYGEERFILLGTVQERLLAVSFTMRDERIRIISARFAEPRERRRYHEENS